MELYAKYVHYVELKEDVEDIGDVIDENEPSICYQCSKIVNGDIEGNYSLSDGKTILSYTFYKFLGEYTNEEEKALLTDDLEDILYLCMYCADYQFELKEIITTEG